MGSHNKESMSWKELEEYFGIRIDRPTKENRKIATEIGLETSHQETRVENVTVAVSTPEEPVASDALGVSIEQEIVKPEKAEQVSLEEIKESKPLVVTGLKKENTFSRREIRRGILWSEILQPPLSLRGK